MATRKVPAHAKPPGPGGHGQTGDRHAPALPKTPATRKSPQIPATKRSGKK